MFSEHGESIKSNADCGGRQITLGWIQAAIGATGFEDIAHYWTNQTLDTIEPERWREIVATKGVIGFLTNNPERISVLREKVEAAGGTTGDIRFSNLREGGYGASALHSAVALMRRRLVLDPLWRSVRIVAAHHERWSRG